MSYNLSEKDMLKAQIDELIGTVAKALRDVAAE